jgi:hypothetical protein
MNANLPRHTGTARPMSLADFMRPSNPAPINDNTDTTDTELLIAIAATHAHHVAQGWHVTWPVTTVIENLIDTMSDFVPTATTDNTDPATLAILRNPNRSRHLAGLIDNLVTKVPA